MAQTVARILMKDFVGNIHVTDNSDMISMSATCNSS